MTRLDQLIVILFCFILATLFIGVLWSIARLLGGGIELFCWGVKRLHINQRTKAFNKRQCFHCGYDLRANTHRCPECGHHIPVRPIF